MKTMTTRSSNKHGVKIWDGYLFAKDALTPTAYPDDPVDERTLQVWQAIDENATTTGFTASLRTVFIELNSYVYKVTKRRAAGGLYRLIMRKRDDTGRNNPTIITDDYREESMAWEELAVVAREMQRYKQLSLFDKEL